MRIAPKMFFPAVIVMVADVALAAPVAVVSAASGQVSIQTSDGIVTASRGMQLSEGDRVAVGDGSATVSFLRGRCKGDHDVGPRSITVISSAAKECSKRIEGAKADLRIEDLAAPGLLLLAGGGLAAGLAISNTGGNLNAPFFPISP